MTIRHVLLGLLPARIEEAKGETVTVALSVKDERIGRLVGQDIAVEMMSGRGIYRFNGSLRAERSGSLTVALNGDVERIQRREFVRIPAHLDVTVKAVDEPVGGPTTTVDVSGSGIQINDPWNLMLGLDVRVELTLPGAEPRPAPKPVRTRRTARASTPA